MDEHTEDEIRAARKALLALKADIDRMIHQSADGAGPIDLDLPIGRLSRMEAIQQQQMVAANRRRARLRLQQIESALERLEDGDYGFCVGCDEAISRPRLKARPETPLCLNCQGELERG